MRPCSLAVDAAKTGNVVSLDRFPDLPDKKRRPDFLRKTDLDDFNGRNDSSFEYYPSQRALGHLYRAVHESGLKTPSAVYGGPVLGDGMSVSFGYLRLLVEADLASLLDTPPEPLKHVPPTYSDTVAPVLASFSALFANIARTHTPPNDAGRQVSELELFAVTSLLASQRHDAARGNAIAAMAREVAALVNWLERELTSATSPLGEQVDGETLRLRYSAWIFALESGDEWTAGTKSARWICLALLLETMRTEKARRDKLDEARSPSEVHGPVGPVYGQVAAHSHQLVRPQQPTPPPSPPVTRSGRSVPSSTPMAPTVPLATRPRTSTSRTDSSQHRSVPVHPPAASSAPHERSNYPLRPTASPSHPIRRSVGARAADPESSVDFKPQDRRHLAASQPHSHHQPRTRSRTSSGLSEAYDPFPAARLRSPSPAQYEPPQPLGSLAAPLTPQPDGNGRHALGAYESASDDDDPLETTARRALEEFGFERNAESPPAHTAGLGQAVAASTELEKLDEEAAAGASTEPEELDEEEAAAEAERDKLWQEFRRRKYLEGIAVPVHRPGRRAPTTTASRTGGSDTHGASSSSPRPPGTTSYPSSSRRSFLPSEEHERDEATSARSRGRGRDDELARADVGRSDPHGPVPPRHAAAPLPPPRAHAYDYVDHERHRCAVPLAHPAPQRPFRGTDVHDNEPAFAAPPSPNRRRSPPRSDIYQPWSPPPYAPTALGDDFDPDIVEEQPQDAQPQDEYEPPPTPPEKHRGYFQGGDAPFWVRPAPSVPAPSSPSIQLTLAPHASPAGSL